MSQLETGLYLTRTIVYVMGTCVTQVPGYRVDGDRDPTQLTNGRTGNTVNNLKANIDYIHALHLSHIERETASGIDLNIPFITM